MGKIVSLVSYCDFTLSSLLLSPRSSSNCNNLNHNAASPGDEHDSDYYTENTLFSPSLLSPTEPNRTLTSPRISYRTMHDSYVSQSVDSEASFTRHHRMYRRHREQNYDEEQKRREYRSRDSSFDSLDSERSTCSRSRPAHSPHRPVTCMGADIGGLVRRVRGIRVSMTPETCV